MARIIPNETIIHGSLLTDDLITAFLPYLPAPVAERIATELASVGDDMPARDEILHERVIPAMEREAPEGTVFGTLEGNTSDFGFWTVEDED